MDELREEDEPDFARWQMEKAEDNPFAEDQSNRVFKDEDIKKCQEAMTKKLVKSMEEVANSVIKTRKPTAAEIAAREAEAARQYGFFDLGDIQLSGVLPTSNPCAEIDLPMNKVYKRVVTESTSNPDVYVEKRTKNNGDDETWEMTRNPDGNITERLIAKTLRNINFADISMVPAIDSLTENTVRATQAAKQLSEALTETLDPAELVKANMIEDYLESYLTNHYSSGTLEYDVDLPEKVSDRILAFIQARMYNWTIYTINEQKWRLTWG
jgi:hypothetical protein